MYDCLVDAVVRCWLCCDWFHVIWIFKIPSMQLPPLLQKVACFVSSSRCKFRSMAPGGAVFTGGKLVKVEVGGRAFPCKVSLTRAVCTAYLHCVYTTHLPMYTPLPVRYTVYPRRI